MSSRFDRITGRFGDTRDREQYPDLDDFNGPQSVADPHTLDDETHSSLLDRIEDNWHVYVSFSLLGLVALILVGIYFGRYFVTVATNPWVQRIVAVLAIFAGGTYLGIQRERTAVEQEHELTLYDPNGDAGVTIRCEYRTVDGAPYPVVIPYKGNRGLFGGSPEPYTVGDLSRSLVKAHGHDPDAPVRIRLHPEMTDIHRTDRGLKVTQATDGLSPDPYGTDANLEASLPETADEETVIKITSLVRKQSEEIEQLKEDKDVLRRQRNEAREMARKTFDEYQQMIDNQGDLFTKFLPSNRRQNGQQDTDRDQKRSGSEMAMAAAKNGEDK
jgi:hypothetical protein